jgi:hypothetical protein
MKDAMDLNIGGRDDADAMVRTVEEAHVADSYTFTLIRQEVIWFFCSRKA